MNNKFRLITKGKVNSKVPTTPTHKKNLVKQLVDNNKGVLSSMLKMIEFCGKQGLPLYDTRDDGQIKTESNNPFEDSYTEVFSKGNLCALYRLCIESGDEKLGDHLERCKTSDQSTSKKSVEEFLDCIKEYIQEAIVNDVKKEGQNYIYGLRIIDLTNQLRNGNQLGIVIRYVKNFRPIEKLIEIISIEEMTGKALANQILDTITNVGLAPQACRFQTYDVMGNMSRHTNICATIIKKEIPHAHHFYYAANDLNLSFCRSSKQHEFQSMMFTLKQLNIFFQCSIKRQKRLEQSLGIVNQENKKSGNCEIRQSQVESLFSEDWLNRYSSVEDFLDIYAAVINCLESMLKESKWDFETVTQASVLIFQITSPEFITALQTSKHFSGYLKSMSVLLQGSLKDVLSAYDKLGIIRIHFVHIKENIDSEFEPVYEHVSDMHKLTGKDDITITQHFNKLRKDKNMNTEGIDEDVKSYLNKTIFLPFIEHLIAEFDSQFSSTANDAVHGLQLIPSNLHLLKPKSNEIDNIMEFHQHDLPSLNSFTTELKLWRKYWETKDKPICCLQETLRIMNPGCFPNIHRILSHLLVLPITTTGMAANSSLIRRLHTFHQSLLDQEHHTIVFLYVHKDVILDYESIVNAYSKKYPKRMKMLNPLSTSVA